MRYAFRLKRSAPALAALPLASLKDICLGSEFGRFRANPGRTSTACNQCKTGRADDDHGILLNFASLSLASIAPPNLGKDNSGSRE